MGLNVRFVENLDHIVDPVVAHLTDGATDLDLFETQYLIVPTAGVRAWLAPRLAAIIGATAGERDGILANVRVGYLGLLNALLREGVEDESDAWSIERVTMAVLSVINSRPTTDPLVDKHGGHLRAARAMADRFDRYAARRPQLIRDWERAFGTGEEVGRDSATVEEQFALWSEVRRVIGVPSWPARTSELCARMRAGEALPGLPRRLMVAGIETISAGNLELLAALGNVIDVEVLCVHPSPVLHERWAARAGAVDPTPGSAPQRHDDAHVLPGADLLVTTWLRGAYELQMLLASQGISTAPFERANPVDGDDLLSRMKRAVAAPDGVEESTRGHGDRSVQVHRAHNLARQVEILRDALLHAFNDLDDLRPHEILVLCADIEAAAPLLKATFDQPIATSDGRRIKIPLVVADRSLRDVSPGAELLADVLSVIGSRFDVSGVMRVATHDLVLARAGAAADDVDTWTRHIGATRVRWGLDVEHRAVAGLNAPALTAHTWKQALDRALLGALLPDAPTPARELGGVVPLTNVDTSEIDALTALSGILATLARLEEAARVARPVPHWCDEMEDVLVALCGPSCTDIDDPLALIASFRESATLHRPDGATRVLEPVRFEEFADLLLQKVESTPGRQPLRTGAVTATSFVPLRSVPFRVVCVVGLDDGTLSVGETEGDDIVASDPVMGDPDPRLDARRVLLAAFLAAGERFIITCNGRSIKNNSHVPLVTPLAELIDFCGRLGVDVPEEADAPSAIEHLHPRHASGRANFVPDTGPVPGVIWSHDRAALVAAESVGGERVSAATGRVAAVEPLARIPLAKLEAMIIDPLTYYLRESLGIYREYDEADPGALLPVSASELEVGRAAEALVRVANGRPLGDARTEWSDALGAGDVLPVAPFDEGVLKLASAVATAVSGAAAAAGVPVVDPDPVRVAIALDGGLTAECDIPKVVGTPEGDLVYAVRYDSFSPNDITRVAVRMLVLRADGRKVRAGVVVQRAMNASHRLVNTVTLDTSVTPEVARERLRALAAAEPLVRSVPCPSFGGTAAALVAARDPRHDDVLEAFDDFIGGHGYARSTEFLVYGADPDVGEAYPPDVADLVDFLETRTRFVPVPDGDMKRGSGEKAWVLR